MSTEFNEGGRVSASPKDFLLAMGMLLIFLTASAFVIARRPDFQRGLHVDEFRTLQNYTWAGINDDGTRRSLDRLSDIEGLGTPSPRRFLMGIYCSLGRWPEPNNHIIYSALTNVSLAMCNNKIVAFRLPALVCAGAFALAVALVCWRCGWRTMAPATGAIAFWNPYVVHYAQEARGYTVMLSLVMCFLLAAERALRKPRALIPAWLLVILSILLVQNTVNMIIDWVGPCFLMMLIFPGIFDGATTNGRRCGRRRKLLLNQIFCVGCVVVVFFMDRLPYVYTSTQQYGYRVTSPAEFFARLTDVLRFLFPSTPWVGFLILGAVGGMLALRERPGRGYVALSAAAILVTLIHFAAAQRFTYVRNNGYWLIPVLLGYGCLGQRACDAIRKTWSAAAGKAILYGVSVVLAASVMRVSIVDEDYELFRGKVHALSTTPTPALALYSVYSDGVGREIQLDCPENWLHNQPELPETSALDLILVRRQPNAIFQPKGDRPGPWKPSSDWPNAEVMVQQGPYSVTRLPCRVARNWPESPTPTTIALWYPSFESVSLSPERVLEILKQNQLRYYELNARYQAKMEVFGRLACIAVLASTEEESRRLRNVLEEGQKRFGGEVVVLLPHDRRKPQGQMSHSPPMRLRYPRGAASAETQGASRSMIQPPLGVLR